MISNEFLTHRVVQEYLVPWGKISIFPTFGGHLGFEQKIKKCEYLKNCKKYSNFEFLTRRVVQEYPIPRKKVSIFATFGGHPGF